MKTNRMAVLIGVMAAAVFSGGCDEGDLCPGLAECGGKCADLENDPANCGECGVACAEGQVCFRGACSEGACSDECDALGAIRCADPPDNGLVLCADYYDADRCLEWGNYTPCPGGGTCLDGVCQGGCEDGCTTEGERRCEGDGYSECARGGDGCLAWGAVVPCETGVTCSAGACSAACVDECTEGETDCEEGGVRSCGQHDDDACLEWSPVEACAEGWDCEDGACVETQCLDAHEDCVCGENQCCEGHCCPFLFICIPWDPQEDWCPNGPGPNG